MITIVYIYYLFVSEQWQDGCHNRAEVDFRQTVDVRYVSAHCQTLGSIDFEQSAFMPWAL